MLYIRSTIFNVLFYLSNAIQMIFWTPIFFFLPKQDRWKIAKMWAYSHLWLQAKICDNQFDFSGIDNIENNTNLLVAGKHQSAWETYTLILFFDDPAYVLKRSLMSLPLFGWYASKMEAVPIDRGRGSVALASMTENAKKMTSVQPRQIIIYPEGTRKIPGAKPTYKYGITHLYSEMNLPVVPFALDSGMFWSRQSFLRYPGVISLQFLKPIKPGLSKKQFSEKLENMVENASNKLMLETAKAGCKSPHAKQFLK